MAHWPAQFTCSTVLQIGYHNSPNTGSAIQTGSAMKTGRSLAPRQLRALLHRRGCRTNRTHSCTPLRRQPTPIRSILQPSQLTGRSQIQDIRVASVQFHHVPGDKGANWARVESYVEQGDGSIILGLMSPGDQEHPFSSGCRQGFCSTISG